MRIKPLLITLSKPAIIPVNKVMLRYHYRGRQPLTEVEAGQKVLVIAPHMDDETIGLGGTIRKHADNDAEIECLFVSDGAGSTGVFTGETLSDIRKREINQVQRILGFQQVTYMDYPDGRLNRHAGLTEELKKEILRIDPDIIYCTTYIDAHPDHVACAERLAEALLHLPDKEPIVRLYEINCPLPPNEINCIIDISATFKEKQEAIKAFQSQVISFDGFLELNLMKRHLTNKNITAAEVFLQLSKKEFIARTKTAANCNYNYQVSFKQANRTATLLWAVFKNASLKKKLYHQ